MTVEAIELIQGVDGRWRWAAHASAPPGGPGAAAAALLSFKSRDEAAADALLHANAPRDATGRQVMSKDYLRRLISAIALPCESCVDVYFGGVYWHRRDREGANWGVAIMNGAGDHGGCLACVQDAREALRARYSIADEG
jgi:hypothetical protein